MKFAMRSLCRGHFWFALTGMQETKNAKKQTHLCEARCTGIEIVVKLWCPYTCNEGKIKKKPHQNKSTACNLGKKGSLVESNDLTKVSVCGAVLGAWPREIGPVQYESGPRIAGIENGWSAILLSGSGMLDRNDEIRMLPGLHEWRSAVSSSEGVRVVIHPPNTEPYPFTEG